MAAEKIDTQIKKREKQVKTLFDIKGIDFKEWYLEQLNIALEENLDTLFEIVGK